MLTDCGNRGVDVEVENLIGVATLLQLFIPEQHRHTGRQRIGAKTSAQLIPTAGHPSNVIFLTADAFGVLPPISRLSVEQARYHFLSGYTAKVAGTERGIDEPQATFSACFGAPFLALKPTVYSRLLGEKVTEHGARCWLINTGWTGGPYGVGGRSAIPPIRRARTGLESRA